MLKLSGSKNHKSVGHIIGIFRVGLDTDQQVYVFLSVLGRKYQFSVWAAKYFSQGLSYRQGFRDRGHPISFFYHLSSLSSQERDVSSILPSWGPFCPYSSLFCPFQVQSRKRVVLEWGWVFFMYGHIPERGL